MKPISSSWVPVFLCCLSAAAAEPANPNKPLQVEQLYRLQQATEPPQGTHLFTRILAHFQQYLAAGEVKP